VNVTTFRDTTPCRHVKTLITEVEGSSKESMHIYDSQIISDHLERGGNEVSAGDHLGVF
jgi:hypothetical protein